MQVQELLYERNNEMDSILQSEFQMDMFLVHVCFVLGYGY